MKKYLNILLIISLATIISCTTTQKSSTSSPLGQKTDNSEIKGSNTIDLTSQLRKLPGLTVRGDGESAVFTVRGVSTIVSGNQPLFVVDGVAIQDYPTVFRMVTPDRFKSARILKNASETSFYGVRGANGVILIKTKN